MWTVNYCNCDGGFEYCHNCEEPCDHDKLCRRCRGWEWYPAKITNWIEMAVVKTSHGFGPYRTRRDAWASIEQ